MARKSRDTSKAAAPEAAGPTPQAAAPTDFVLEDRPAPAFRVKHYLAWIGLVIAFCVVQLLVVRFVLGETQGVYFFFSLLVTGFVLVSVFDYLYDRHIDRPAREPEA